MIYAMEAFKFILLLLYPQKKKKKSETLARIKYMD